MTQDKAKRVLSALGLCRRAGKCVFGTDAVCEALRGGKLHYVAIPADNSENTRKKLTDKCSTYRVPLVELPVTGEELAHATGRTGHAAAVGVADESFAQLLSKTVSDD